MRILILCKRHYINKDLIIERFGRLYYFPKYWHAKGDVVTIIATEYGGKPYELHKIEGLHYHSVGFPSRFYDYFKNLRRIIQETDTDIIIAGGDSHFGYLGIKIARKLGLPFVFDLHHHYADFGSNRIPGMKFMYYAALRSANLTVCDSEVLRDRVKSYCRKTFVAPQGTDMTSFRPLSMEECRQHLGLDQDGYYLGYTGALDKRFDLKTLTLAIKEVQGKIPKLKLLVAGPNPANLDLCQLPVELRGAVPHTQIPIYINACDLMLIPYNNSKLAQTCNPSKLSEYIGCKKPIVASRVSNVADYLPRSSHLLYQPGDHQGLAESILKQFKKPIVEIFTKEYTWEYIANRYRSELLALCSNYPGNS